MWVFLMPTTSTYHIYQAHTGAGNISGKELYTDWDFKSEKSNAMLWCFRPSQPSKYPMRLKDEETKAKNTGCKNFPGVTCGPNKYMEGCLMKGAPELNLFHVV